MYFRRNVSSPMLVVCLGIWRNIWSHARDWNKSNRKGRTRKKKVTECIRSHVTCTELCLTNRQGQAVSGSWNEDRERKSAVSGSQNVREGVTASHKYIWRILLMWSASNVRDKIKGDDVVMSTNHVTFLTNRFSRLISLPTSTIFVSGTSGITVILKI